MWYNDNIIFLHIQKTSGTTFEHTIKRKFELKRSSETIQHDRLIDKDTEWIKDRNTYSFLRCPYDWYKSYYSFLKTRLTNSNVVWRFIAKEWKCISFDSFDDFIEDCTINACNGLKVSPFLIKHEGNPYSYIGDISKNNNIGLFSAWFLDYIRLQEDIFPINKDHTFFFASEFYKYHRVNKRHNTSNSQSITISEKSKALIDEYDMPTYNELLKQVSNDYDIFR